MISAVVVLLARGPLVNAQTARGDLNFSRLSDVVRAIDENQLPRAEELLNSVLATSPADADALNLLGVVRAKQNRPAEAERLFRQALSSLPSHVSAHINLAELLLSNNKPAEAMPVLLRAHKLAPKRAEINLNLATILSDKGNHEQAYQYLRLIPREACTDDYFLLMLRSLTALKRSEDVRSLANEFRQFEFHTPEIQAEFALLLAKSGANEEALNLLQAARQNAPGSFPVLYALGVVTAALKQYDKADEYLTAALATKPDDVPTLRALARVARANGNLEKALSHLVAARRAAPTSTAVLYDFGVTALQMDLILDALPVFKQLHRDHPKELIYLYALAAAHWRNGETVETTRLMNDYVARQPRDPSGLYLLGAALLSQDQFVKARTALERSLSLKADPDTQYLLGVCLEKLGNRAAAIETLRSVVQARPDHAAAFSALGSAYRESGNYAEARIALERAIQLDPDDLRANYQLGLIYAKLGDNEAAKKMFARADDLRGQQRNRESVVLKLIDPPPDKR
jgi:tetratricopeptide (TPR) repeat protein